ncbi:MAG: family 16 glycosylhydrolase [Candidatus Aenigmarchaeota archaeon]|nr:family 16 glycosylhydrolase [Candidatus Aenigmarchaeota archaeon]
MKNKSDTTNLFVVLVALLAITTLLNTLAILGVYDRITGLGLGRDRLFTPPGRSGDPGAPSYRNPIIPGQPIPIDTTPPSVPTNLVATATSCSSVSLDWTASADSESAIAGYIVYRDGVELPIRPYLPGYGDGGLAASTTYAYMVAATNTAGLVSAQSAPASATTPECSNATGNSWRYDFDGTSLDTARWVMSSKRAPGYIQNSHIGYFEPNKVSVSGGYLRIQLTQERGTVDTNSNGVISRGGEIRSIALYGYGTYEWRMRMSSTAAGPLDAGTSVPGTVSAGFNYVDNSRTEIDFEVEGDAPNTLYMTTWLNPDPTKDPAFPDDRTVTAASISGLTTSFKTYKFVWSPGLVQFYVDGVLKATHTTDLPSAPAYFMVNHWGSNWGGISTPGTARYLHVDWVRYTAPGEAPV